MSAQCHYHLFKRRRQDFAASARRATRPPCKQANERLIMIDGRPAGRLHLVGPLCRLRRAQVAARAPPVSSSKFGPRLSRASSKTISAQVLLTLICCSLSQQCLAKAPESSGQQVVGNSSLELWAPQLRLGGRVAGKCWRLGRAERDCSSAAYGRSCVRACVPPSVLLAYELASPRGQNLLWRRS